MSETWTGERVGEFRRLRGTGLTFDAIAKQMGLTKNQVISKAKRLGFLGRRVIHAPPSEPAVVFPGPGRCVWPHGDPGKDDFHFCGEPVSEIDRPYCPEHEARAWVSPRREAVSK